jgi:hypothetical protein
MEDIKRKGEEVEEVSIGLDGDWFLRTNSRHGTFPPCPSPALHQSHVSLAKTRNYDAAVCKTEHGRADMISNVEQFVQLVQQAGLSLEDYAIQFFTFVPDPTGYITVLHKTDGSLTRCAWHNVPHELDMVLEREGPKGVRHVTVGVNGAYAVISNSGAVSWGGGVPGRLHQLLEDAVRRRRSVVVSTVPFHLPS